uniref:Beta-lactamase-related domain-containing protein n=1 Tax=Fibrocapsa japonica TaxID=94617 RepID=A0A7S2V809_9STRA
MDPRIFNYKQLRDACLPAANGHATAAALASLFSTFLPGGSTGAGGSSTSSVLSQPRVEEMSRLQAQDQSAYNQLFGMSHGMRYGLGYQLFGFRDPVPTPTPTSSHTAPTFNKTSASAGPVKSVPRFTAFGHVGAGGSVVMCDPTTGFVFAMTLNKIVEGREATRQVLQLVCEELGVGMPVAFVE